MPSNSIDSCARVNDTVPLSACGHTNRPRSKRLAKRQSPSPSHQSTLIRSPRRPRNTNTCPANGSCSSFTCTIALKPVKPRRRSVRPAAIQICVPAGSAITRATTPKVRAANPDQPRLGCRFVRSQVRPQSRLTSAYSRHVECLPLPSSVLVLEQRYRQVSPVPAPCSLSCCQANPAGTAAASGRPGSA